MESKPTIPSHLLRWYEFAYFSSICLLGERKKGRVPTNRGLFPSNIQRGQPFLDGQFGQFGNVVNTQFFHDPPAVGLNGLHTDA